jgi:hypothetical protein
MKTIQCLGIGILGLFFIACPGMHNYVERGSGRMISEQRTVSGINGVSLATTGDLLIEVGNYESLRIEADDNLISRIQTDVRDGILTIQTGTFSNLYFTQNVRYYLTVRNLNSISIVSSGNIQAPDLKADRFLINVSSSGNLKMGNLSTDALDVNISSSGNVFMGVLKAGSLNVNISSSGDLNIGGGEVEKQNIAINSSGKYQAPNLASEDAGVAINSSGDAAIRVRDRLSVQLNSSGNLHYWGNPSVNINKNSSGDIIYSGN